MNKEKKETYSYKGWIISDSFIKRSLASTGYHFMGVLFILFIYLTILVVGLVIGGIVWLVSSIF
jgi:hypothetical protein